MPRAILAILLCSLTACSTPQRPDPIQYELAPADFTLDITIQGPTSPGQPRAARPARYIVEPDGMLRVGVGEGVSIDYFPPQTRQLTRAEFDRLWRLVRDSPLLVPDNPDEARPGLPFGAVQLRPTASMAVTFEGHISTYRVVLDGQTTGALAAEQIVDHLAELAWIDP